HSRVFCGFLRATAGATATAWKPWRWASRSAGSGGDSSAVAPAVAVSLSDPLKTRSRWASTAPPPHTHTPPHAPMMRPGRPRVDPLADVRRHPEISLRCPPGGRDRDPLAGLLGRARDVPAAEPGRCGFRREKAQVLLPRHVPLPERRWPARGA